MTDPKTAETVVERCPGCGNELPDPNLCYCGSEEKDHSGWDNHPFVPIGCDCLRDKGHD